MRCMGWGLLRDRARAVFAWVDAGCSQNEGVRAIIHLSVPSTARVAALLRDRKRAPPKIAARRSASHDFKTLQRRDGCSAVHTAGALARLCALTRSSKYIAPMGMRCLELLKLSVCAPNFAHSFRCVCGCGAVKRKCDGSGTAEGADQEGLSILAPCCRVCERVCVCKMRRTEQSPNNVCARNRMLTSASIKLSRTCRTCAPAFAKAMRLNKYSLGREGDARLFLMAFGVSGARARFGAEERGVARAVSA